MKKIIFFLILASFLPLYAKEAEDAVAIEPTKARYEADADTESDEDSAEDAAQEDEQTEETPSDKDTDSSETSLAEPVPYKAVYLLDYAELESEDDAVPESAFSPNSGRYQFIENADARDSDGRTLLMKAAKKGNIELIENLLYSEADVNAADDDGWTALMFAARFQDNPKAVALLLNAGAKMQAENNYGITALLLAAGFSHSTDIVSLLMEKRSIAEKEVLAAFIYAVVNEASSDTLQLFIDKGIAINAPYEGKTALMYAAESNVHTATIAWLLKNGARIRYKTAAGKTAFDYARANKQLPKDKVYWSLNTSGAAR